MKIRIFLSVATLAAIVVVSPKAGEGIPLNPPYGANSPRLPYPGTRNRVPRMGRLVQINGRYYYEILFNGKRIYQPVLDGSAIYTDEPDSHDLGTWSEEIWVKNPADANQRCNRLARGWSTRGNVFVHGVRCNKRPSRGGDYKCTCIFRG